MIEVKNLSSYYKVKSKKFFKKDTLKAVESVSFKIEKGQTLGVVGESGSGKSSLARAILKLQEINDGQIFYQGSEITNFTKKSMFSLRKKMQIIFQDPYSSLNPRLTIQEIVMEGIDLHSKESDSEKKAKLQKILDRMGLKEDILDRYPHEFSGGQRQRISIARSLILEPEFLVADEIVSALDVSNQAQVLNLLQKYKKDNELSILFISHDLNVISYISDLIAVMYLGKIIEFGTKTEVIKSPSHPYTKILFSSSFKMKEKKKEKLKIIGEIPSVLNKPTGCYFHTRCPIAKEICKTTIPEVKQISKTHTSSCHFS
jgi:oligopeptide/dipeptide ABC transporter ATP-binding protein